jgi:hypothetical protein
MGHYRIYQLDPSDHIAAGFSVECGSDAAAVRAARTLLDRSAGVEVWKSNHRLAHLSIETRLTCPAAAAVVIYYAASGSREERR